MNDLEKFLHDHRGKFGTLQDLARDMNLTFSGLLRAKKAGTLSVENCLGLAEALGEQPAAVFRAAKRPDLAEQFERLYGKATNSLPAEERRHLEAWRELTDDSQHMVQAQMKYLPKRPSSSRATADDIAVKKRARSG